jgi:hypothetical protein
MLLQDFNEIDRYLLDASMSCLTNIEDIKKWGIEVENKKTARKTIDFWKYYLIIINRYIRTCLKGHWLSGLIYRQAVET